MLDPSKPQKEYIELMEVLAMPTALMGGTKAMREAGALFLPQNARESDNDYQARLNRSFLFGGYERTVSILAGEVFDKVITLQDDTSQEIIDLSFNIDLMNRNLTRFSRNVFEQAITNGSGHILVDTQPLPKDANGNEIKTTKNDDKKLKRRPYWVHIPADRLIGYRLDKSMKLTQIRILENVQENDGEFDVKNIEQIRVIEPGAWRTYRKGEEEGWILQDYGSTPLKKIALVSFYTGKKKSDFTTRPPLTGLAELNQQHWVSSSDQNNILHVCRVPILFGKMLNLDDNGKVIVSVQNMLNSQDPDGDLKYVEHSGKAIADGWTDLNRIEMLMQLWGLDLITNDRSGNITATEKAMTGAKTGSFLNACAQEFQDVLNSAIELTCEMLGIDFKGGALVNTDFSLALQGFDTNVLLNAWKTKLLDRATCVDELKRRGIIGENADPVEIAAAIENEMRSSSAFGAGGFV